MTRIAPFLLVLMSLLIVAPVRGENVGREAGRHFQRGVDLYGDGDFRGALVEFKRAYTLLPRANVLYDIGETEFQLQDYAAALTTMRRFLSETGSSAPHRAEVEATVEVLRGRVGRIALSTDVNRCEVMVDDQVLGTTPLAEPILVSVGPRRVSVSCADRPPTVRRVEVSAGELVRVDLQLGPTLTSIPKVAAPVVSRESLQRRRQLNLAIAWTSTALLTAAAIGVGTTALVESSQLDNLRQTYPVTAASIDQKATLTSRLAIAADVLGAAALTAIGVSTYVTLKQRKETKVVLGITPGGLSVRGTF